MWQGNGREPTQYSLPSCCRAVRLRIMTPDVTHLLSAIEHGDARAAEQLLPLVYDELRKLAAAKLAQEKPGQALEPTPRATAGLVLGSP